VNIGIAARNFFTLVVASTLAACGGGGGGIVNNDSGSGSTTVWANSNRSTLTTDSTANAASTVLVGVVDTGFLTNFYEISGVISASQDFGGTGVIADNVVQHGTEVAEVIAGQNVGYSGNSRLLVAKVADSSGTMYASAVSNGAVWAMNNGAKVMNFSLSPMWETSVAAEQAIYNTAISKDAVVVMAAGNGSTSVSGLASGSTIFSTGNESMAAVSLVVGALSGNALASYSNYAGDSTAVQSRFLVATGTNYVQDRNSTSPATSTSDLSTFSGTSSATPVVSAAAAQLRSYWPSLTAPQTAQLLLDTADQSFSGLYSVNTCGASSSTNCGLYYFGKGRLNLSTAMQPVGAVSIATGTQVNGAGSYSVASSSITLPAAFGDAVSGKTITSALFDSYGRNFNFNLLSRLNPASGSSLGMLFGRTMIDHELASSADGFKSRFAFDRNGELALGSMDFQVGRRMSWGFTKARGYATGLQETALPMLGLTGSGALGAYDVSHEIRASMTLDDRISLNARTALATTAVRHSADDNVSATRHEIGVSFKAGKATMVTAGLAFTREANGMLGAYGSGALALDGSSATAATLKVNSDLARGWSAFGYAELGAMQVNGSGTLTSLSGVRTSQYGAGLQWSDPLGEHLFGLAVSQPIRVDSANANFRAATGRTLDGQVIYSDSALLLSPSGRQLNLDLAYQHRLSKTSSMRLNAVWIKDKNHIDGNSDAGLVMSYRSAW
jgi:hypothetical protein